MLLTFAGGSTVTQSLRSRWHGGCFCAVVLRCLTCCLLLALAGCNRAPQDRGKAPAPSSKVFSTNIHGPDRLVSVKSQTESSRGGPLRVTCVSCHSARGPRKMPKQASDLKEFHVGFVFQHGNLECSSCHDDAEPHRLLHLATGERVEMPQAMRVCAQCHGPQKRDYDHGAHGGMNGYWDLSRGSRVRNNCVDCHDPHKPAIPQSAPVLPPRDRYLEHAGPNHSAPGGAHHPSAAESARKL